MKQSSILNLNKSYLPLNMPIQINSKKTIRNLHNIRNQKVKGKFQIISAEY